VTHPNLEKVRFGEIIMKAPLAPMQAKILIVDDIPENLNI
jgi:hypothetical protein